MKLRKLTIAMVAYLGMIGTNLAIDYLTHSKWLVALASTIWIAGLFLSITKKENIKVVVISLGLGILWLASMLYMAINFGFSGTFIVSLVWFLGGFAYHMYHGRD